MGRQGGLTEPILGSPWSCCGFPRTGRVGSAGSRLSIPVCAFQEGLWAAPHLHMAPSTPPSLPAASSATLTTIHLGVKENQCSDFPALKLQGSVI